MKIETIRDGIKDYIQKYIQDYLDDESVDDIEVKMYSDIIRATDVDIMSLRVYPALIFEYNRSTIEPATTTQSRTSMPINFYSVVLGSDPEKLMKLCERYVWALKRLFETNRTLEGLVEDVQITGYDFSPKLPKTGAITVMAGMLEVTFVALINNRE